MRIRTISSLAASATCTCCDTHEARRRGSKGAVGLGSAVHLSRAAVAIVRNCAAFACTSSSQASQARSSLRAWLYVSSPSSIACLCSWLLSWGCSSAVEAKVPSSSIRPASTTASLRAVRTCPSEPPSLTSLASTSSSNAAATSWSEKASIGSPSTRLGLASHAGLRVPSSAGHLTSMPVGTNTGFCCAWRETLARRSTVERRSLP